MTFPGVRLAIVFTEETDLTVLQFPYAVDNLGKLLLSVSGNTGKADDLTGPYGQIQVIQGKESPVAAGLQVY